ncbi:sulfatase-like hydrolase/transferase [Nocardioides dubius]|uniref:Sulfatase-like hydrolase/transferase n=1 Tax=Nocardioides dubius TaxID=317019 RepID=A0ABP4ECM5_9ACTN
MGRKILFITTDQQRYDAYGCNGGTVARTPVTDALASEGIRYERAYSANVICTPARSSMLTGQHPRTHGAIANGVPLPQDAPSIAATLADAGYRTALIGKVHFEPIADPDGAYPQNRLALTDSHGPYRGFDYVSFAGHGPLGASHYANWLRKNHPDQVDGFLRIFATTPGGDTGAPAVKAHQVARENYHTDWIADQVIAWLDTLDDDEDWFCWMSFPDPHHPWDLPASERDRIDWRTLDLPAGHPGSPERIKAILSEKPAHWLAWYDGSVPNIDAAPGDFVPADLTDDQIREVNAVVHIKNELLDEAYGRVLEHIRQRGQLDDTDVIITTDHGEFQGDLGLLFKGPYHVDALMRLPMIWRPAPSAGLSPAVVSEPVSQVDLAPTFCAIAGIETPEWIEGTAMPTGPDGPRRRALIEWDSQLDTGYRMRTIAADGWLCTAYEPTDTDYGLPRARRYAEFDRGDAPVPDVITYDGTEGELYNVAEDPHQWRNLWDDPASQEIRAALVAEIYQALPTGRQPRLRPVAMG